MTSRLHALTRSACIAVVATAGLTLGAAAASAHSNLIDSNPADGDVVAEMPDELVLTFSDGVQADYTQVAVEHDGTPVTAADPVTDGDTVTQALGDLPAGTTTGDLTVSFRIISADGHPVEGTLSFTVDTTLSTPPTEPTDESAPDDDTTADEPDAATTEESETAESGADESTTDDATPAASGGDSTSDTSTGTLVAIGAAIAVVVVGGGYLALRRARRTDAQEGTST